MSLRALLFIAATLFLFSCAKEASEEAKLAFENVIPKPVAAIGNGKRFVITKETSIVASDQDAGEVGQYLAEKLKPATGFDLSVSTGEAPAENAIYFTLEGGDTKWGSEGYEIAIEPDRIKIVANKPAGLFYAVQTIRQLLPEGIELDSVQQRDWEIGTGTIQDQPEYGWRGSMLDVARHFFTVEDIKRYIDLISFYKMNTLHLHLSDDQGWRIEIKSWPNLTAVGAKSEVGGGEGGFFTQEQYKEIVAYAQSRFITVIPEIDLPGHINAALVSYPELLPGPVVKREPGGPVRPIAGQVHTGIEVGFSTLSLKKPSTFKFVEDVIRELAAITPGPYIHIGGDEAKVTKKEDYITFINRFGEIVKANGKKMIGWEEIAQADIDSTVYVQHWDSEKYAKMAAEKNARLIFSPAKKIYLDMQYDSTTRLGLHWAAFVEVDSSYIWDPATQVEGIEREHIVGVEAPLWSETLENMDDIEYMLFPRLPGVAEIGWSAARNRNWDEYKKRLARQRKRWKNMEINYYQSPIIQWVD
jgi:hexosaminidase